MGGSRSGRRRLSPEAAERLRALYARIRQHQRERDEFARAMLEVKEREQVTVREIAQATGIPRATVQEWLRRARNLG